MNENKVYNYINKTMSFISNLNKNLTVWQLERKRANIQTKINKSNEFIDNMNELMLAEQIIKDTCNQLQILLSHPTFKDTHSTAKELYDELMGIDISYMKHIVQVMHNNIKEDEDDLMQINDKINELSHK
jgi:hypothetical protein